MWCVSSVVCVCSKWSWIRRRPCWLSGVSIKSSDHSCCVDWRRKWKVNCQRRYSGWQNSCCCLMYTCYVCCLLRYSCAYPRAVSVIMATACIFCLWFFSGWFPFALPVVYFSSHQEIIIIISTLCLVVQTVGAWCDLVDCYGCRLSTSCGATCQPCNVVCTSTWKPRGSSLQMARSRTKRYGYIMLYCYFNLILPHWHRGLNRQRLVFTQFSL